MEDLPLDLSKNNQSLLNDSGVASAEQSFESTEMTEQPLDLSVKKGIYYTGCGVMFAARPCSPGTLFYTFEPGKPPIFSFIINKFMICNFVLRNAVHKLTHKCGFLGEMTCPANMGGRRTSLHNQYTTYCYMCMSGP